MVMVNEFIIEVDFTCDKCYRSFRAIAQGRVCQCKRCGKMFVFCDDCKPKANCDWCGSGEFGRYVYRIEREYGPLIH